MRLCAQKPLRPRPRPVPVAVAPVSPCRHLAAKERGKAYKGVGGGRRGARRRRSGRIYRLRVVAMTKDFYSSAVEAFSRQMAASQGAPMPSPPEVEKNARVVVEEMPKIDSAVKAFLSLVAARSAVASDIDVLPAGPSGRVQCTFVGASMEANRCALLCARTLLATINSTLVPESPEKFSEDGQETCADSQEEMETTSVTRVIWNSLVKQQSTESVNAEKRKLMKPSKVLGRRSLVVAYPFIKERFRRGVHGSNGTKLGQKRSPIESLSDDSLPAVDPPNDINADDWIAFYTEFGDLLSDACVDDSGGDSKLLWSEDHGQKELELRREKRAQRVKDALASTSS